MIYAYFGKIDLFYFRLFGPGLGNILLTWARTIVYAKKYKLTVIEPTWPNIKIGTILRNEKDYRFYFNLFKKGKKNISGLKKIFHLIFSKKIYEKNITFLNKKKNTVFIIKNDDKNFFDDLRIHQPYIKKSLLNIIKQNNFKEIANFNKNSISIHVRRGDFVKGSGITSRTSDKWFVDIINFLNKRFDKKIYIFSDARDNELLNILKCKNVERKKFKNVISEILAMSRSKIFVGSKNSTLSHWVSFLGLMPTIWPLDCNINKNKIKLYNNEIETDGINIEYIFLKKFRLINFQD